MKSDTLWLAALAVAALVAAAPPAAAQTCNCDDVGSSICSGQGFEITLVDFAVDQDAGTSSWDYEVCNDKGLDADCLPPKDLSHVDLSLPSLGSCLNPEQDVTLTQVGGFAAATLSCGVSEKDPSCDLFGDAGSDYVAKCDVSDGSNLDPGECVVMRLTIAGEQPTLGAGAVTTITKAGPECIADCILGPSCQPCVTPPMEECLTRTAGFWGTHPHVTQLFLPVTACGELTVVEAGSCDSATEALCVAPGKEAKKEGAYAQLVRQLTAAKLNLAASAANGGFCSAQATATIAGCEALCDAGAKAIAASGCIEALAAFNESQDTFPTTPPPFDRPGPANPAECREANGNGLVIGLGSCS